MEYGEKAVLLKYGKTPHNCIENHIDVLKRTGFCWFGKIGVAPSIAVMRKSISAEDFFVILMCQDDVYLCNCVDVTNDTPEEGIPAYYESYLYGRGIYPKIYFKLDSIECISKCDINDLVVLSSRNNLLDTVKRSMASFFYAERPDPQKEHLDKVVKEKKKQTSSKVKTRITVDKNDCIYRNDGVCVNKRCISYEYECTRPSNCIKQRTTK